MLKVSALTITLHTEHMLRNEVSQRNGEARLALGKNLIIKPCTWVACTGANASVPPLHDHVCTAGGKPRHPLAPLQEASAFKYKHRACL